MMVYPRRELDVEFKVCRYILGAYLANDKIIFDAPTVKLQEKEKKLFAFE